MFKYSKEVKDSFAKQMKNFQNKVQDKVQDWEINRDYQIHKLKTKYKDVNLKKDSAQTKNQTSKNTSSIFLKSNPANKKSKIQAIQPTLSEDSGANNNSSSPSSNDKAKGTKKAAIIAFFQDKNNLAKSGSLVSALAVVAVAGIIFTNNNWSQRNISNYDTSAADNSNAALASAADSKAKTDGVLSAGSNNSNGKNNDSQELVDDLALYMDNGVNRGGSDLAASTSTAENSAAKESGSAKSEQDSSRNTKEAKDAKSTQKTTKETSANSSNTKAKNSKTQTTTKPTSPAPKTITVQRGEGWWHLGQRSGVDFRYLAVFNGKLWTDPIYTGQTYKIPTAAEIAKITLPKVTTPTNAPATAPAKPAQKNTSSADTGSQSAAPMPASSPALYSLAQFMYSGRLNWNGLQFTYYSQSVLPGYGMNIPGRHVSAAGYVCDGDGYIVLASDYYSRGTVINTPFGAPGKVYDRFGTGQPAWRFDVYIR